MSNVNPLLGRPKPLETAEITLRKSTILDILPTLARADDRFYARHRHCRTPPAGGRLDASGGLRSARPRDVPRPSGATICTHTVHTVRAASDRSDARDRDNSRGMRGTTAAFVRPIAPANPVVGEPAGDARHAVRWLYWQLAQSCITRGSHAPKEHAMAGAGSGVPVASVAHDARALGSYRAGARKLAQDALLQPNTRGKRSECMLPHAANVSGQGVQERSAPAHFKLSQDPLRSSTPPCCVGCEYSWRSCVMVGTSRGQPGGWTGAAGVLRRACGACCGNGCSSAPVPRQCYQRAPRRCGGQGAHRGSGRRARSGLAVLCWPLAPSAPAPAEFVTDTNS